MDSFTASDGYRISFGIDDFTDPWRSPQTLLLLHAAMGSSRRWYAAVPVLARHYRVLRMDLRGHGESQVPPAEPSLSMGRLVQDVHELLDHLGCGPVRVVGNIGRWVRGAKHGDDIAGPRAEPNVVRINAGAEK